MYLYPHLEHARRIEITQSKKKIEWTIFVYTTLILKGENSHAIVIEPIRYGSMSALINVLNCLIQVACIQARILSVTGIINGSTEAAAIAAGQPVFEYRLPHLQAIKIYQFGNFVNRTQNRILCQIKIYFSNSAWKFADFYFLKGILFSEVFEKLTTCLQNSAFITMNSALFFFVFQRGLSLNTSSSKWDIYLRMYFESNGRYNLFGMGCKLNENDAMQYVLFH